MTARKSGIRQDKVHTELGRTAAKIFAASDRMNQLLIEHLDPAAWRAKPPGNVRTIAAIFTHMHNVRTKWIRLTAPHLKSPPQLNAQAVRRSRPVRDWHRALPVAKRCWLKLSVVVDESRSFTETAGQSPGR